MSRADDLRAMVDQEALVMDLEDELVRLKGLKRPDEAKVRETKAALREERQRFRELREGAAVADGDAVASPGTVEATAGVGEVG